MKKVVLRGQCVSRPFSSSLLPRFQNEAKCKTFSHKNEHEHVRKTTFLTKALHSRPCFVNTATQKWPTLSLGAKRRGQCTCFHVLAVCSFRLAISKFTTWLFFRNITAFSCVTFLKLIPFTYRHEKDTVSESRAEIDHSGRRRWSGTELVEEI